MIELKIPFWSSHHNLLIYSCFFFTEVNRMEFKIKFDYNVKYSGAILNYEENIIFFDYSDDSSFIDNPNNYNYYFKRSLLITMNDEFSNVYPLNFQVNLSYKAIGLLRKIPFSQLKTSINKVEFVRALDYFNCFTNLSHNIMDIRKYPTEIEDHNGKIIFYTRLWNPNNHSDKEEKERRRLQNQFRINACRIIKKEYKNAFVGLFSDALSNQLAPDLILPSSCSNKKKYLSKLSQISIGIADDGLKDTPGWKIGEYLSFGKAVITTPLNIVLDNFNEGINYEKLSNRSSFEELPEKIEYLLKDKRYMEIGRANKDWSNEYIHPQNYIKRIFNLIGLTV